MKARSITITLTGALVASMLLTGCGNQKEEKEQGLSFETDITEETQKAEETATETPITIINHGIECMYDSKVVATGNYPEIQFSKEYQDKYPRLWSKIASLNMGWNEETKETVAEYGAWKLEDERDYEVEYTSQLNVYIERADEKLFTIKTGFYDDAGGAHPNHGATSLNFDPQTGNEISIQDVIADQENFAANVRTAMEKANPDAMEEIDLYFYPGEDSTETDPFQYKFDEDSYTWVINEEGLYIEFSPYEIASYATGYMEVTLSYKDYPDLIKEEYRLSEKPDVEKMVEEKDGDTDTIIPTQEKEAPDQHAEIENPTFDKYVADGQTAANKHVNLTMTKEEKSDWLDTEAWCAQHGFAQIGYDYKDEDYEYMFGNTVEYDYMYNSLYIYDIQTDDLLYDLDFYTLCNGPDEKEGYTSHSTEYLKYAKIVGDILYAEVGHAGYASEEPKSNYIVAYDLIERKLLFRSEPMVAGAANFQIVDDTIICGYGFTEEPDYIYLLDRFTGDVVEQMPVNSAPAQFEIEGDTLYVATYNTAYEFQINK